MWTRWVHPGLETEVDVLDERDEVWRDRLNDEVAVRSVQLCLAVVRRGQGDRALDEVIRRGAVGERRSRWKRGPGPAAQHHIPVETVIEDGDAVPYYGKLVEINDAGCRVVSNDLSDDQCRYYGSKVMHDVHSEVLP